MDETDKWLVALGVVACFCSALGVGFYNYQKASVEREAMKSGYVQEVDKDTGRTLWVKP